MRVVIAGGGPAGASLAIRLAACGIGVTLIERAAFPRHKLCGEFISPECGRHFEDLGLISDIASLGGARIERTVFYDSAGRSFEVPAEWLGGTALSLSRGAMDLALLDRAKRLGVEVIENASVNGLAAEAGRIRGFEYKSAGSGSGIVAGDLFIDATGRSRIVSKLAARNTADSSPQRKRRGMVGVKSHMRLARSSHDTCEIYSFPGGYGGLSPIEDGLSNLCLLVTAAKAAEYGGNIERLIDGVVSQNARAHATLDGAELVRDQHTVAVSGYGLVPPPTVSGLIAVGDAGAFIDPFTGSGILMAFEASELASLVIRDNAHRPDHIAAAYEAASRARFGKRLGFASLLRRASSRTGVATLAVFALSRSMRLRRFAARSTRGSDKLGKGLLPRPESPF